MTDVLIKIAEMSLSASAAVILILLIRPFLRRAPKYVRCILWAVVGLRLCVPFTLQTKMSPVPNVPSVYETLGNTAAAAKETANASSIGDILTAVWLSGIALMLIYAAVSYIHMYRRVTPSVRSGEVYLCDNLSVPFILGMLFPKIYIPSSMKDGEMKYVVAHETAHIKRGDHLIKPFSFLILSVYWFNPVIWVWYIFLCRDIELACDEKAINQLDKNDVREYSLTLLTYSSERKIITACPVAFGEVAVKTRIKSILNYKKPAFWVTAVSLVLCVAVTVCFFTERPEMPVLPDKNVMAAMPAVPVISDRPKPAPPVSKETGEEKLCPHEYEKTVTDATCTADGSEKTVCRLCGEEQAEVIPARGHSYYEYSVSPTCTEAGYLYYTCSLCGDTYYGEALPETGHSIIEGEDCIYCTRCDYYEYTGSTMTEEPQDTIAAEDTQEVVFASQDLSEFIDIYDFPDVSGYKANDFGYRNDLVDPYRGFYDINGRSAFDIFPD